MKTIFQFVLGEDRRKKHIQGIKNNADKLEGGRNEDLAHRGHRAMNRNNLRSLRINTYQVEVRWNEDLAPSGSPS